MTRLLEAVVVAVKGTTRHTLATPNGVIDMPRPQRVIVMQADDGCFFLMRETARGAEDCGDTWHETLEGAKHQATFEYDLGAWVSRA